MNTKIYYNKRACMLGKYEFRIKTIAEYKYLKNDVNAIKDVLSTLEMNHQYYWASFMEKVN